MVVVAPRLAGIRQIEQHDVEMRLQVAEGLGKGCQGGQRAIDQQDGPCGRPAAMQLRVDPVSSLNIQHSDFRFHLACLPNGN